ncbi:MAG: HlyD family efflux transporter periplasmic adaptor subunit [Planctomycetes bacterium]|nr:HlyD family efflux transporter periplasmic adaptor subunit [Planctomycetota bacterium]
MQTGPLPELLPNLSIAFHADRKGSWYSMRTPDNRFLRIGAKEYLVVSLLDGIKNAEQIAQAAKDADSGLSIDAIEVLRVVDWLGKAGVLITNSSILPSSHASVAWNPMFIRQNLISGPTIEQVGRLGSVLVSNWLAPFLLTLWFVAAMTAIGNWQTIWSFTQKLFVPDSLLWWVATWAFLKTMHEIGHASYAVKFGCRIHSAGVCWMLFSPVPFVDISGMWLNSNRWQRCLCCLGGIIFEMTISSVALLVFLSSDLEAVRYACCMLFTTGAISSIAVNGMPFMKFDGYHVLSEWLAWPNLYADGQSAVQGLLAKILRPWRVSSKPVSPWLAIYGLLCVFYRFTFWMALLLGSFFAFNAFGLFVVGSLIVAYVFLPMLRQWMRAFRRGNIPGQPAMSVRESFVYHAPTIAWASVLVVALGMLIVWMPSPYKPMIPGFVEYSHPHLLRNETDGFVETVFVRPGDRVKQGQVLAALRNLDLETNLRIKQLEVVSLREQAVLLQSQQSIGESQAVKAKLDAAQEQLDQLQKKIEALMLRSPCDGTVVDSYLHERMGQFVKSGEDLGMITENEELEAVGFVEQSDIDWFRANPSSDLCIRLPEGTLVSAKLAEVLPRACEYLESPQLAANFGGPISVEIETSEDGSSRWRLPKPRFKIKATLSPSKLDVIRPGQTVGISIPDGSTDMLRSLLRLCERYWDDCQREAKNNEKR